MSEPVAKPRYLGEPRNVFDLEEIERRMRESIEPPKPEQADPLAELARLVGQGNSDAFSRVFADRDGPTSPPPARQQQSYVAPYEQQSAPPQDEQSYAPQDYQPQDYQAHEYQPQDHEGHQHGQEAQAYAYGHEPQGGEAYAHHDQYAQHDAYAQPASEWQGYYQQDAYVEEAPRRTGRAKLLIGAAIVIAVGGSAAAFMTRGPAGAGREAPTIMANAGPTKVQPAEQPSDGPKQSISILERGGSATTGQAKIVQNEEQPVDVTATARVSGSRPARAPDAGAPVTLAPPPPPPVANSLFAEPKRVKAVAVRPDGTIIDPSAPVRAPATPKAETPVAAPVTPPPAPAARPNDIASLMASSTPSTTPGSAPKPAARAPEPKPTPKPAATVASIPAPTGAGGSFSVQLAGTTSAEEAKDAAERLTRKYAAELGGYRPSVVKAEVGSKIVYRVRVKGLSSEDANTLCARLKAGNGSCFVARN